MTAPLRLVGQPPTPKRGDGWRCPGCGYVYPLADWGDGRLMPVQPPLSPVLRPIRNLLGPDGRPAPITDPAAFLRDNACRMDSGFTPHPAVCAALAKLEGRPMLPPLLYTALAGPPPDCATCGQPWTAHQVAGCECKWVAPPAEPAPESDGV